MPLDIRAVQQALKADGLDAWLRDSLQEHGWSAASSGYVLAVGMFASAPVTLAVPLLADRFGSRRSWMTSGAALAIGAVVVWPFLADGIFTFLRRLRNGENVFQAHRTHVYQRLVIAGHGHPRVTVAYGCLALLGAGLALAVSR